MVRRDEFLLTAFEYRGTDDYKNELKNLNEEIREILNKDFDKLWKYSMSQRIMQALEI